MKSLTANEIQTLEELLAFWKDNFCLHDIAKIIDNCAEDFISIDEAITQIMQTE